MANTVDWCGRWDHSVATAFDVNNNETIDRDSLFLTIAGCGTALAANIHTNIMQSNHSKWIKIPSVLLIDLVLLAAAPFIAVAETALRLALAIITLPLLFGLICSNHDFLMLPAGLGYTAIHSLCAIVNVLYTSYLSLTTLENIRTWRNQDIIFNFVTCDMFKS